MHNGLTKIEHGLTISEYAHKVIVYVIFQLVHEDFVNHTNQKTDAIGNGSCTFKKWEGNLYVCENVSIDELIFIPAAVLY